MIYMLSDVSLIFHVILPHKHDYIHCAHIEVGLAVPITSVIFHINIYSPYIQKNH